MSKKRIALVALFAWILVVLAFASYYIFFPKEFYTEQELLEKTEFASDEIEILDIVKINDKSYYVPLVSSNDAYGASFWAWTTGKWEEVGRYSSFGPQLFTSDDDTFIMCNLHPDDKAEELEFYLTFQRSYLVDNSTNSQVYLPTIQMKHSIQLGEQGYGLAELPSEWEEVMGSFDSSAVDNGILPSHHYYTFHYQALNAEQEPIRLESTVVSGGGGYSTGGYMRNMMELNPDYLE